MKDAHFTPSCSREAVAFTSELRPLTITFWRYAKKASSSLVRIFLAGDVVVRFLRKGHNLPLGATFGARCRRYQGLPCLNTSPHRYRRDQRIGPRDMKGSRGAARPVHFYEKKRQVKSLLASSFTLEFARQKSHALGVDWIFNRILVHCACCQKYLVFLLKKLLFSN